MIDLNPYSSFGFSDAIPLIRTIPILTWFSGLFIGVGDLAPSMKKKTVFMLLCLLAPCLAVSVFWYLMTSAESDVRPAAIKLTSLAKTVAPVETAPTATGCWQVLGTDHGEDTQLTARWLDTCPVNVSLSAQVGERAWPTQSLYLPASPDSRPKMTEATTEAVLDTELAVEDDVKGGLLYLPTKADGSGYFVAGWVASNDSGDLLQKIKVGRYGARPWSVPTSGGRIYLHPWRIGEPSPGDSAPAEPEAISPDNDEADER